ncbi:hypothetical protein [Roseomonas indoligenes]|uniref:Uncharacterized protein n=1 Tax=Roseomonas indoligenes TaxID=2820811 RepID=A0A940MVP8_9PROT|nr:hypothetical protein [Pararoseomonas indoligenes]MBP0492092.1 hypothetical protein [Pararoseomonas indoligenes]
MATTLRGQGANFAQARDIRRVRMPASLGAPTSIFYLGGTMAASIRNLAAIGLTSASPVGSPVLAANYMTFTANSAFLDTLLAETAAGTWWAIARAKSANVNANADKPVLLGNLGTSPGQSVTGNFGLDLTTNGVPSGQSAPHANLDLLTFSNTASSGTPVPSAAQHAQIDVPDIQAWRLAVGVRNPGVEARLYDKTLGATAAFSLVGKTTTPNTSRSFLIGSDYSGTRLGQCDVAAVGSFPTPFSLEQTDTLAAFLRAALGARGLGGF